MKISVVLLKSFLNKNSKKPSKNEVKFGMTTSPDSNHSQHCTATAMGLASSLDAHLLEEMGEKKIIGSE